MYVTPPPLKDRPCVVCARCDTPYPGGVIEGLAYRCASSLNSSQGTQTLNGNYGSTEHDMRLYTVKEPKLLANAPIFCDACVNVLIAQSALVETEYQPENSDNDFFSTLTDEEFDAFFKDHV